MFSGVVKLIMSFVMIINWFFQPRIKVIACEAKVNQYKKNPAYKSCNGF